MERMREILRIMKDTPKGICISPTDDVKKDYIKGGQDGLCFFSFIYNNICVYIQNDSEISEPYIEYKYVKSQIDVCDLDKIKKTFNFLNKEMSKD